MTFVSSLPSWVLPQLPSGSLGLVSVPDATQPTGYKSYNFDLPEALANVLVDQAAFGVVADGVTDDSAAIQAMVTYISAAGGGTCFLKGNIAVANSIYVPANVAIQGLPNGETRVIPISGGTFAGGFIFGLNTTNMITWAEQFPQSPGDFANIYFVNDPGGSPVVPIRGVNAFGSYHLRDLRAYNMTSTIRRPAQISNEYIDNFKVTGCQFFEDNGGTEYQIDIRGPGDGLVIEECNFYFQQNAVKLAQGVVANGVIRDCIGGNYSFDHNLGIVMERCHLETSYILNNGAQLTLNDCLIYQDSAATTAQIQCSESFGDGMYDVVLNNTRFMWGSQFKSAFNTQVSISSRCRLIVKNSWKYVNYGGGQSSYTGLTISANANGSSPVTAWNNYSYMLSKDGLIDAGRSVALSLTVNTPSVWNGLNTAGLVTLNPTYNSWTAGNGTFYYRAQLIYEPVTMIGQTNNNFGSGEVSVAVSGTTQIVSLAFDGTNPQYTGLLRMYRGTSTGSYDKYADIPIAASNATLNDDGTYIAGVAWSNRAAGGVDTIYTPGSSPVWRINQSGLMQNVAPRILTPGNAALALTVGSDITVIYNDPINADRAVTPAPLLRNGDRVRLVRTAACTGAFNVTMASTPATTLGTAGTYTDMMVVAGVLVPLAA